MPEVKDKLVTVESAKYIHDSLADKIDALPYVSVDLDGSTEGEANSINADTLGGRRAEEYALVSDLENLPSGGESYDDTELRRLISVNDSNISDNSEEIKNLKELIGDTSVSTKIDSAIDTLRQEILGGEW